ncbi:MAG: hypothetical protein PHY44_05195 [Lachnospiraceae bacterium]|nr:hypothetical protein [Lachnospiraceae bacterium]
MANLDKLKELEMQFDKDLIARCKAAQKECGHNSARFIQAIERWGGVATAKELIKKSKLSDGFLALELKGRLDLTMEATVVDKKFTQLFTDEEVNYCFEVLCESGYYQ